ncbi:metal-dependent hydrolase [Ralstonia nicotianae]
MSYHDAFGHRGATHSILFALVLAVVAALVHPLLKSSAWRCAIFVGLATLSHPLLDACTNGGMGVALLWPFSEHASSSRSVPSLCRRPECPDSWGRAVSPS